MKNKLTLFTISLLNYVLVYSQNVDDTQLDKKDVAIFAPFYLDSAFNTAGGYKYDNNVPRYLAPSLEFYTGVSLALDSLSKAGLSFNVKVYDTRSPKSDVYALADNGELDNTGLIIGSVAGAEYMEIATIAKEKKIPFLSVSYPNDGGITANPHVLIVNPKLNTHLLAIYNHVLRNLGTNNLVMFKRKGSADDRVAGVIEEYNKSASGNLLNIKTVTLNNPVTIDAITAALNTNRENVIIAGSIDDQFNKSLINHLKTITSKYKITLVGMPTWEGYRELLAQDVRALPFIYSSAFYNPEEEGSWAASFFQQYAAATYLPPSELAFKGYEVAFIFTQLLQKYGSEGVLAHMNDKNYHLLTEFDFKPIHKNKGNTTPDYYENKRIYILKRHNGVLSHEPY